MAVSLQTRQQPQSLKALMGVRDLILGGSVRPGERLSEVAIAERLGISRTPIRAALARLEQEGLLELSPSGGFAVRGFAREEVIDAIELRGVLEGTAARLAAERGVPPARMKAIKELVRALDETVRDRPADMEFERYVELNAAFHEALAGLSGSETIRREIGRVRQAQHKAIVNAIDLREGGRAEALAREHARLARQNLEYVIAEDRSLLRRMPALALVGE